MGAALRCAGLLNIVCIDSVAWWVLRCAVLCCQKVQVLTGHLGFAVGLVRLKGSTSSRLQVGRGGSIQDTHVHLSPSPGCIADALSVHAPADFGLARSVRQPLEPLWNNGVVVTIW